MARSRSISFFILIAVVLFMPTLTVAQSASPVATPAGSGRLFSIALPRDALPDTPVTLAWDEIRIEPGFDGALDIGQPVPARAMYVMDGDLTVTVPYDALAWREGAAVDGDATPIGAGDTLTLVTGDLLLLPHRPSAAGDQPSALHLVNNADSSAHIVGFRVSDAPIMPSRAPEGLISRFLPYAVADPGVLAAGTVTVSLDRVTIAPGDSIEPDSSVEAGFYEIVDGRITYGWTAPGQATPITYSWAPLVGRWIPWAEDVQVSLTPLDDAPATLLVLLVTTSDD